MQISATWSSREHKYRQELEQCNERLERVVRVVGERANSNIEAERRSLAEQLNETRNMLHETRNMLHETQKKLDEAQDLVVVQET